MTQENDELLLKDLCARLPYKVKISIPGLWTSKEKVETLNEIFKGDDDLYRVNSSGMLIRYIKPYLFPLSSMTEEQKELSSFEPSLLNAFINGYISLFEDEELNIDDLNRLYDWLNENHFDYRGLIKKSLALDATGLNIY